MCLWSLATGGISQLGMAVSCCQAARSWYFSHLLLLLQPGLGLSRGVAVVGYVHLGRFILLCCALGSSEMGTGLVSEKHPRKNQHHQLPAQLPGHGCGGAHSSFGPQKGTAGHRLRPLLLPALLWTHSKGWAGTARMVLNCTSTSLSPWCGFVPFTLGPQSRAWHLAGVLE